MKTMKKIQMLFVLAFCLSIGASAAFAQTTPVTFNENVQAGQEAVAKNDFNAALKYYSKAIELEPANMVVVLARAGVLTLLKKYDDAMKDTNVVLKAEPQNAKALTMRGSLYNVKGDYKKALKDIDAAIKTDPNHADAYMARGISYMGQKKYQEGVDELTTAIRLNPRNPGFYRVRAAILKQQGNGAGAQADELKAAMIERGQ